MDKKRMPTILKIILAFVVLSVVGFIIMFMISYNQVSSTISGAKLKSLQSTTTIVWAAAEFDVAIGANEGAIINKTFNLKDLEARISYTDDIKNLSVEVIDNNVVSIEVQFDYQNIICRGTSRNDITCE